MAVTITVRAVEQNNWTVYPVSNLIGISSSSPAYTVLDSNKNLSSGEALFYVRFLRPDMLYTITANDLSGVYAPAQSRPIPVTVTSVGSFAFTDFTRHHIGTAVKGEQAIQLMEVSITNPNSGGANYVFKGVTLTVSTPNNGIIESAELRASDNSIISSSVWADTTLLFLGASETIGPMETVSFTIAVNLRQVSPHTSFKVSIASPFDVLIEKLNGVVILAEAQGSPYPYESENITLIGADLSSSFYNYPNPFNPSAGQETNIQYFMNNSSDVSVVIYDLLGRRVRVIADGMRMPGGSIHRHAWDGKNDSGKTVLSGVYYCVIKTAGERHITKISVVR